LNQNAKTQKNQGKKLMQGEDRSASGLAGENREDRSYKVGRGPKARYKAKGGKHGRSVVSG